MLKKFVRKCVSCEKKYGYKTGGLKGEGRRVAKEKFDYVRR